MPETANPLPHNPAYSAEWLDGYSHGKEARKMASEGINTDKVIVNAGGGGESGGLGSAALVAALGNRNESASVPALIAALGNRNDDSNNNLAALMAAMGGGGGGFGGGGINGILAIAALGLIFGRGRGGLFGGDGDGGCCDHDHARTALIQSLVEGQADLRAAVPTVALETQNAIQHAVGALALGTQQGLSNLKDSVQASAALNLSATQGVAKDVATGTLQTIIGISNDGDKTRALITGFNNENLQRELTVSQLSNLEHRLKSHTDNVEVRVNQNVNQTQGQLQAQFQQQRLDDERFARLFAIVANIGNQVQRVKADQDTINFGTMLASGNQATTSTQVR